MSKTVGFVVVLIILAGIVWFLWEESGDESDDDSGGDSVDNFISLWAHAITPAENVNPDYNNPGGLNMDGDEGSTGSPDSGGGTAKLGIFSTLAKGYSALENTLTNLVNNHPDASILDATAIYVFGPNSSVVQSGNYPQSILDYATGVANRLGVSINDTIGSLAGN
jgi:hypothetical protein